MKALPKYFLQGSLILTPIAITVYVIYWVISSIGSLTQGAPLLTIPLAIGLVMLLGYLVQNVVGRTIFRWVEDTLQRVPLVGLVYSSIRDLLSAFVGDRKSFDKPVAVTLSSAGAKAFGFITRDDLGVPGLEDHVAVYLPQSYNFAGNLIVVPRATVQVLDISSAELMKLIVSGAISGSP